MNKLEKSMEPIRDRLLEIIEKYDYGRLRFSLVPSKENIRLLETYPSQIKAWRDFMFRVYDEEGTEDDVWEECHFHDVCCGFMSALGVNSEDSHYLATFCRYNLQDFETEYKLDRKADNGNS